MSIPWDKTYLIGRSWGLKGSAQDISKLVKTIINEYKSQTRDSKEYAARNNITELDVCDCLEKANKNIK